jgi:hypothetical protein
MKRAPSPQIIDALQKKDPHMLETLLSIYSVRLLHHSNQLWSIGAVFIPLSLSGVVFGLNNPVNTLLVGVFSIILIWIWYLISVNLRALIDQTYRIIGSLESVLLNLNPPCYKSGLDELVPSKGLSHLKFVRLMIPIIVTIGWITVIIVSFIIVP